LIRILTCGFGLDFKYPNETQTDLGIALDIDFSHPDFTNPQQPSNTASYWSMGFFKSFGLADGRYKRDTALLTSTTPSFDSYGLIDADGFVNIDNSNQCLIGSYLSLAHIQANESFRQVIAGLYWAVTTTTGTGFGDLYATNQTEQVLFLLIMVAGRLFYGYIVACIAAAQANIDAPRSRFFERLVTIKKYMVHEHLPESLRKRVVRYYEYLWLRTQGIDPQSLILGLPSSLTGELALQLHRKVIDQIPIFKNTPLSFKKMVALMIRPLYILQGEYVTRIGDIGSDLFFLHRGSVEIQYQTGEVSPTVLRSGRILGEVAFLSNQKAKTSFRAKENSDLYYVTKHQFEVVLDHFPEVRDRLMDEATENMELEAEHRRLFEARPRKGRDEQSVSYYPKVNLPIKERLHLWTSHIFPSNDKFVRYFNKFTMTGLRIISVMLILYQVGFSNFLFMEFYYIHYSLEVFFVIDIILLLRVGFLDEYGKSISKE
jgi:hypothetical protein